MIKMYWAGTEVNKNEAWSAMCFGYFNTYIIDKGLVLSPKTRKRLSCAVSVILSNEYDNNIQMNDIIMIKIMASICIVCLALGGCTEDRLLPDSVRLQPWSRLP